MCYMFLHHVLHGFTSCVTWILVTGFKIVKILSEKTLQFFGINLTFFTVITGPYIQFYVMCNIVLIL